jgi:hypothetical protein
LALLELVKIVPEAILVLATAVVGDVAGPGGLGI